MSTNLHIDDIGNLILRDGKLGLFVSSQYVTPPHYGGGRVGALCPYAVEQVDHYYVYGGIIGNLSSKEGLQEFKFGDKKLDRTYGLDLYDFEARQYDAITPWFTSIDPLAEKFTWLTPYNYCAGDPVNCVDPDGRDVFKNSKYGRIKNVAKVPGKTVLVFINKEKVTSVLMFDSDKGYDQALNGMQSREFKNDPMFKPKTVTYGKMSAEQAMDLQDIMTKNTDVEWSAHTNQEGEGLLSTTHEEGTVQVDKAIEYSDFSEDESSLKMHGHPGRGDAEGTRGGSALDIDKPSNGRLFVNHQGTGKIYEYKKDVQAVDSFGSYSEWKKKIFNKNKR